ncbi:hypothetical protein [Streptomyces sp. ICC4]|uniref:hypothetical protein n=1 Tax=Streptomyces sp. ICC4 TaxID=2099584 RepID=UPI001EF7B5D3|nr:hypothetical protein [Streptomyces sp. ICC4]
MAWPHPEDTPDELPRTGCLIPATTLASRPGAAAARPPRRTRSASDGSASQAAEPAPEAAKRSGPRSTDAPWHDPKPAFDEPPADTAVAADPADTAGPGEKAGSADPVGPVETDGDPTTDPTGGTA